jgi:UDP-N-acetylmuramoyl-tripeptide--D-alanyl-D-alanine ligase
MRHFFKKMKTDQLYSLFKESEGISTDTRTLKKGEMFFALWGGKYNGNHYAGEALEKGASVAVIDDPQFETDKTILVDDCLFELQALAALHRKELKIPVLAITGTNGKTTTKELIAAILSKKRKVHYTQGNLNNHIGVPLTILSAPADTEMMIVEMGANHIGEIRTLCLIAKPDYGIITNVGVAHIEGFGSFDSVVKAKSELYEYLKKVNGVAIYNDKNQILTEKIFKFVNRAVPYSDPTGTDLLIEQLPSDLSLKISAEYQHKTYTINTNLFGKYNVENIKAAIATCLFLGVEMPDIVNAIESYVPGNNRSQIKVSKNNTIICDSYNANPKSMIKALESFADINADKKLVILGDMLELGDKSSEEHLNILKYLKEKGFSDAFLVGPIFSSITKEFGYKSFPDVAGIKDFISSKQLKGRYILVKGSRGIGLERIYDLL